MAGIDGARAVIAKPFKVERFAAALTAAETGLAEFRQADLGQVEGDFVCDTPGGGKIVEPLTVIQILPIEIDQSSLSTPSKIATSGMSSN